MIGSFVNEFDTSKEKVCVYINGEKVLEPTRSIVEEYDRIQRTIFEPKLNEHGVPQQDALVIKVVRSVNRFVPSIITVEGWGPAGTLYGFRMLLEDLSILSQLAKFAESKSESFEALIVVEGVRAEEVGGKNIMMATGPLHIEYLKPILIDRKEEAGILAAFTSALSSADQMGTRSLAKVYDFEIEKKRQLIEQLEKTNRQAGGVKAGHGIVVALDARRRYNYEEDSATPTSLLRPEVMPPTEREPIPQEDEAAKARALKEVRDSAVNAAQKGIPAEDILEQTHKALQQKKSEVFLRPPKPGENYPLYPGNTDALEWLERQWGTYLKRFNPGLDRDYLYQDQLGKLDPKLLRAAIDRVAYKRKRGEFNKETTLGDFVPPKKKRIDLEIADRFRKGVSPEDIKEISRLDRAIRRRQ